MSYREKIERYKKQQLTEEETKEVEAEIEKTEAISDYLADRLMDDLDEDFFAKDGDEQADTKEKMEQSTASAKEFEAYVKIHSQKLSKNGNGGRWSGAGSSSLCTVWHVTADVFSLL